MESTDATLGPPAVRMDLIEVAHLLVLIQGAILVFGTLEAIVFLAFAGTASIVSLAATAGAALVTLATAAGLARGSRRARRWTLVAEAGVIVIGVINLALSLLMTGQPLPPVPLLGGLVVPAGVIAVLRRS